MPFRQKSPDESDRRGLMGKDPDHAFPSPDLLVQPFLGVGAPKTDAVFLGKGKNAQDIIKPVLIISLRFLSAELYGTTMSAMIIHFTI